MRLKRFAFPGAANERKDNSATLPRKSFLYCSLKTFVDPRVVVRFVMMDLEGYQNVFADGLPSEDGAYMAVLSDDDPVSQLLVRSTTDDGKAVWTSADRKRINEDSILLYKRMLITPDPKKK